MLPPFHLALPVDDLNAARTFYVNILGCTLGRSSDSWIDFNFYGHQLVVHQATPVGKLVGHNPVDAHNVPAFHFGVVLPWDEWIALEKSLRTKAIPFLIEPHIRFKGKKGEQMTMFFSDPAGNAIEIKAFKNIDTLFAK